MTCGNKNVVLKVEESAWEKLSKKKIYFGHKSVGYDIWAGIKDLLNENPNFPLNIKETHDPEDFIAPILAHSSIGENRNPFSKIDAFAEYMDSGIGDKADIAFFKFCYVDFSHPTDIDQVFTKYTSTLYTLKNKYPKTTFIHVTVPLMSRETGIKVFAKKVLGRKIRSAKENIYRSAYNAKLRKHYFGKEPIFDLAFIESMLPNGKRMSFEQDGEKIFQMAPQFTDDGGHLNNYGRKIVARYLIDFLTQY